MQVGQQVVEGGGLGQRRQPHLVCRTALAAQAIHHQVKHPGTRLILCRDWTVHLGQWYFRSQVGDELCRGRSAKIGCRGKRVVRPGDVGRLEPRHPRDVVLEEGVARLARQQMRVGHAEHEPAFVGRERPQADAIGQMRFQPTQPALLKALRREEQVNGEAAAQPSHHDEELGEIGLLREQFGELVDHDQHAGQRFERRALSPSPFVVENRGVVAGRAQQLLAAHEFAAQRVLHAVDQRQLLGQVGDDRGGVRQAFEPEKRCAAFEIGQHEVELLR